MILSLFHWPSNKLLIEINRLLIVSIFLTNGFVFLAPLFPKLNYEVKTYITKPVKLNAAKPDSYTLVDRTSNHLILPTIQLDEPIFEGYSTSTINKGIWHRPQASSPNKGGNTVLAGHRFDYSGAAVFYSLDKIASGDDAFLVYDQKIYHYKVNQMLIVAPSDISVESPSPDNRLTFYTCTPLWTAKQRLVFVANLVEVK